MHGDSLSLYRPENGFGYGLKIDTVLEAMQLWKRRMREETDGGRDGCRGGGHEPLESCMILIIHLLACESVEGKGAYTEEKAPGS